MGASVERNDCKDFLEDYMECLHHKKEVRAAPFAVPPFECALTGRAAVRRRRESTHLLLFVTQSLRRVTICRKP